MFCLLHQAIVKSDELYKQAGTQGMDALIMRDMVRNYDDHVLAGRIMEYLSQDGATQMAAWRTEAQGRRESVVTSSRADKADCNSNAEWLQLCSHLSADARGWTQFAMLDESEQDPPVPAEDKDAMMKHTIARVQEAYDQITRVTTSVRIYFRRQINSGNTMALF